VLVNRHGELNSRSSVSATGFVFPVKKDELP
jgi:hypothetical protein